MSRLSLVADAQVIDLISLKPFDMEAISNSIKKTRNAIVVEECMKTGGIGASLSAIINESLFDELDHQVRLLSPLKPLPCPVQPQVTMVTAGQDKGNATAGFCAVLCAWMQNSKHLYMADLIGLLSSLKVSTLSTQRMRCAQVVRLSSQDVPTAYAYELEAATIVQPEQVVEAVQKVVGAAVPA